MSHPLTIFSGAARLPVVKLVGNDLSDAIDPIAVEQPLEIRLEYGPTETRQRQPVSITMRTPGQDRELAVGFLFTEGILPGIEALQPADPDSRATDTPCNTITIALTPQVLPDLGRLQRHFYTTSSCGVCGKTSIEALHTIRPLYNPETTLSIDAETLNLLPSLLREGQDLFELTGGVHAAGLFDSNGNLLAVKEDIGRHNAVDKLIGHALLHDQLPLTEHILLLSGRACFELIQKAAMAGIRVIAAVGPPSSLAVQLAEESGITLIGFLRQQRFNIYSGAERIRI